MKYEQFHRRTFTIAGLYNLCWGAYAGIDPQGFFRMAGLPPAAHPQIFACLGMVVGVYGLLYWEVARAPEQGWAIAAIGLLGKILGPIGMLGLVISGEWPVEAIWLCVANDFIWWIPFGLYIVDVWPHYRDDLRGPDAPVKGDGSPGGMGRQWLREDWERIPPGIQQMHTEDESRTWVGHAKIQRGRGLLPRLMAATMPFPKVSEAPLSLQVMSNPMGQTWHRCFGDAPFLTHQHVRADGLMSERARFVELRFDHEVMDGKLLYRHTQTLICLGPTRIPWPRALSPKLEATVWEETGDVGVNASVSAETAGGALVIRYTARLVAEERMR